LSSDVFPNTDDSRLLGVAVSAIEVTSDEGARLLNLAGALLSEGWHRDEASAGYPWRWTDGNARLLLPDGTRTLAIATVHRRTQFPQRS
jgi:hypothetical protein